MAVADIDDDELIDLTAAGDGDVVDALPEDLDPHAALADYIFPNNNRRRMPGYLYLGLALLLIILWATKSDTAVLINNGMLAAAVLLGVVGVFHLITGWDLDVDEADALVAATAAVGFPVGHAAAQMGWRGFLSRPTWRILVYSADEPPTKRGMVMVDGKNAEVVDKIVEDNPEDWSEYDD